ncbi:hypothetical protein LZL87_002293 [Fusarium oxysporum]|nr:hypothetical protein LZL87_002293 [Fusarium oxysporum]
MLLKRYQPPTSHQQLAPPSQDQHIRLPRPITDSRFSEHSARLEYTQALVAPYGLGDNPVERRRRPPLKSSVAITRPSLIYSKFDLTREQRQRVAIEFEAAVALSEAAIEASVPSSYG